MQQPSTCDRPAEQKRRQQLRGRVAGARPLPCPRGRAGAVGRGGGGPSRCGAPPEPPCGAPDRVRRTPVADAATKPGMRSAGRWRPLRAVVLTLALAGLAGCAGSRPPASGALTVGVGLEDRDRALLLLLADRRQLDPDVVERSLAGSARLREALAVALGRIGDPGGVPTLETLLFSPEPEVRRAAAFALGELADGQGGTALLRALSDPDREVGTLAVEALGKLGTPLAEVEAALATPRPGSLAASPLTAGEGRARLLPHLFRFREPRTAELAVLALADAALVSAEPALAARAAYALCRDPLPSSLEALRGLLAGLFPAGEDPLRAELEVFVRGCAARSLGMVGEASDMGRLRPLLEDPAPGPIIQALRAGRRLVREGKAGSPVDWGERLVTLLEDPRPGVRLTALEVAAGWLGETGVGDEVVRLAHQGRGRERELALAALAEAGDPRALPALAQAATSTDVRLRMRVAEAAGSLRAEEAADTLLGRLAADPSGGVRAAVLAARLARCAAPPQETAGAGAGRACVEAVRQGLGDDDVVVRATALDWASEQPRLTLEELTAAWERSAADRELDDARLAAVAALAARAKAEPLERGGAIAVLEAAARDRNFLVRRRAVAALGELGQVPPPVGPVDTGRGLGVYAEILAQTAAARRVELHTAQGVLVLELACPEAPLTCLNFLQLARAGFYDGTTFHRVVPDFVAQGGDPRGDGSGGPGYAIRDEINRLRYERGALGMALSGPDTGGSQFFVTLSPQPHLDGGYTVFGRVVAGWELLDGLVQGERLLRVVEVAAR
jgi:cyclophilin family peptidyl-prolyl cis-trans isomerase/HEAT repeat protein